MSDKKSVPTVPVILEIPKETYALNKAIGHLHAALDALNDLYLFFGERGNVAEEDYYFAKHLALDSIYWSLINH